MGLVELAKQIFLLPGKALAWWGYMFPPQGQVWASGRRVNSTGIHVLYSLVIWGLVAVLIIYQVLPQHQAEKQNRQEGVNLDFNLVTTQESPDNNEYNVVSNFLTLTASSINCADTHISTINLLVCSTPHLLETDSQLNAAYQEILASTTGSIQQLIQNNQEAWLDSRGENCGLSPDDITEEESARLIDCLQDIYDHRLAKLQSELKKPH